MNLGRHRIFPKTFWPHLELSVEEQIMKWKTQWHVTCIYIKNMRKSKWDGNLRKKRILYKRKNWREKCLRCFTMWLQYSKLILFKKGLLIFILRASRIWNFCLFFLRIMLVAVRNNNNSVEMFNTSPIQQ